MQGLCCGRSDVRWKSDAAAALHFETTTGAFLETDASLSAAEYLITPHDGRLERCVYVCLDAPGMGKTMTVRQAAVSKRCLHVLLQCGTGIMTSTVNKIPQLLQELAIEGDGKLDGVVARTTVVKAWKAAMAKVFQKTAHHLAEKPNKQIGLLEANGVDWKLFKDSSDIDACVNEAKSELEHHMREHWSGEQCFVLHIDEIQALIHTPVKPVGLCTPKEWIEHMYVWFIQALHEVYSSDCYKLCLTGISGKENNAIRLDSGIKRWPAPPLPYFSQSLTKQLLNKLLFFDDPSVCDQLAAGSQGCPRAVQYVLLVIKRQTSHWEVEPLLKQARGVWLGAAHHSYLAGTDANVSVVHEALLATLFPEHANAQAHTADGVACALFASGVKDSWMEASRCGVIRIRQEEEGVVIFPPYPFLEAYLRRFSTRLLLPQDCATLVQEAHVLAAAQGSKGRGKIFEFAVALELCLPTSPLVRATSPLVRATAGAIEKQGGPRLLPYHSPMCIRGFQSTSESVAAFDAGGDIRMHNVHVVLDSDTTGEGRPCDVGLPLLYHDDKTRCELVMLDVKTSNPEETGARAYLRFGFDASSVTPTRQTGLLVVSDELLEECVLNLRAALYAEEFPVEDDLAWYERLFHDKETRRTLFRHQAERFRAAEAKETPGSDELRPALPLQTRVVTIFNKDKLSIDLHLSAANPTMAHVYVKLLETRLPASWGIDIRRCELYPLRTDASREWDYEEQIKQAVLSLDDTLASMFPEPIAPVFVLC
jgi:hypothetical protein